MKKIITIVIALIMAISAWAQAPEKMSYQAVVRDASNALVTNQAVGVRISILEGSITGTAVYEEIFNPNPSTNANGLVTLEIGAGIPLSGIFSSIDWSTGLYFIKTETDPTGGTNYNIVGISQLMSVPYALHANTADNIKGALNLSIGDSYQGGIIFWLDSTGQHGLIAASADQSSGVDWASGTTLNAVRNGIGAGKINTERIIAKQGSSANAARACANYQGGNYGDWYLPSEYELNLLYLQRAAVGGFSNNYYWSSTEYSLDFSHCIDFTNGHNTHHLKSLNFRVRAIRSF